MTILIQKRIVPIKDRRGRLGDSDIGDIVMLATQSWCRFVDVGDIF